VVVREEGIEEDVRGDGGGGGGGREIRKK